MRASSIHDRLTAPFNHGCELLHKSTQTTQSQTVNSKIWEASSLQRLPVPVCTYHLLLSYMGIIHHVQDNRRKRKRSSKADVVLVLSEFGIG